MKRLSLILLVVICLFVPLNVMAETNHRDVAVLTYDEFESCVDLPEEFYVIEGDGITRGTGISTKYVFLETKSEYSSNWGYHPSFSTWQYCDGYLLSTSSTKSMTVSISFGSFTIAVAGKSSSGSIIVNADNSRASRPYVYGTVCYDVYRTEIYDDMGNLRSTGLYRSFNKNASVLGYGVKYK